MKPLVVALVLLLGGCDTLRDLMPGTKRLPPTPTDEVGNRPPDGAAVAAAYWSPRVADSSRMLISVRKPIPQGEQHWAICGTLVADRIALTEAVPFLLHWQAGSVTDLTGAAADTACSLMATP